MESYRLKSKVSVNDKEFLVQTVNDSRQMSVVSSLFINGEILEVTRWPHPEESSAEEVLELVRSTHDEKKNELEQLLETYQAVSGSGSVDLLLNLGIAFYYKRIFDEARHLFSDIIGLDPGHHQAHNYLGLTLSAMGNQDEASRALARAVELRPQFADYHNNYGEVLLKSGFCRRALEEFQAALDLNIYYADAYFNLGIAYLVNAVKREDFDMYSNVIEKTQDMFNRALLISPDLKSPQFDEAAEVLRQGDLPRAMTLFQAVREQKRQESRQEYSSFYLRFLLYANQSNENAINDRIEHLRREIDRNPTYVDLHHELALCYLQKSRLVWQKGIDQFAEAVKINPRLSKSQTGRERAEEFVNAMQGVIEEIAKNG